MSQALPTPGREPVSRVARAKFVEMFDARVAQGVQTYGTTLHTENGRDVHLDLEEEILDSWMYAVQARMERERRDAALRRVADLVDSLPEVEDGSVMMVQVRARDVRALREATMEWKLPRSDGSGDPCWDYLDDESRRRLSALYGVDVKTGRRTEP